MCSREGDLVGFEFFFFFFPLNYVINVFLMCLFMV